MVDIFSGCGGLSLGFELLGRNQANARRYFKTVLAMDNQPAPLAVFNRNAERMGHRGHPIGRVVDLTEFGNEAEFLTFYILHVAKLHEDNGTCTQLDRLANGAFRIFRKAIGAADARYLGDLASVRADKAWSRACNELDRQSLIQTSVVGFHEKLGLPRTGIRPPTLPSVLWGDVGETGCAEAPEPSNELIGDAAQFWDAEVAALIAKREGSGKGQLTASARRVSAFVEFLSSSVCGLVRRAWCLWRARRAMARAAIFGNTGFERKLRSLYASTYPVSLLVGGPPCQGFSRIGRGKIRSLREALVHVHGDPNAGDARNLLFQQYVMVLRALRPDAFLFENVQHFQSTVRANGVEFQATDVLAEAIANVSDGKAAYEIASRVIDASRHGVPQARQRFFMAGVLRDRRENLAVAQKDADHCLSLRFLPDVPLAAALAGLPEPYLMGGNNEADEAMNKQVRIADFSSGNGACGHFVSWIRQCAPGTRKAPLTTDGHAARAARIDDAAFFALMGPGKRWMDYRTDDAPTIHTLRDLIFTLSTLPAEVLDQISAAAGKVQGTFPDRENLRDLHARIDGSLAIRLLLEQATERLGSPHHLLTPTYLAKRDGNHGDWVARLDSSRPSKTMVSHMGKDTYGYIHPSIPRTISVREAARIQSFPDWFSFAEVSLTDAFRMIGNAVPPLLSLGIAERVAQALVERAIGRRETIEPGQRQMRRA
jgi:site-specific DNA-cytosine methylase